MIQKNLIKTFIFLVLAITYSSAYAMTGALKLLETYATCKNAYSRLADFESIKIFGGIVATTMLLDYTHNLIYTYNDPYALECDDSDSATKRAIKALKETLTIGCRPSISLALSAVTFSRLLNSNPLKFSELIKPQLTFLSFLALSSLGSYWVCHKQQQETSFDSEDNEVPKFSRTSYRFTLYSAALIFPFFSKIINKE
jgi:hypothetical protein